MPPKTGRGRQKAASKTIEQTTAEEENVLESGEEDDQEAEAEAGPSTVTAAPATAPPRRKRKAGVTKGIRRPRPSNIQRMSILSSSFSYGFAFAALLILDVTFD